MGVQYGMHAGLVFGFTYEACVCCFHLQGERAALNAGVPFLVVGRNMSADTLLRALRTLRPDLVAHLGTSANEHQLQLEQARAQRVLEEGVPLVGVVGTKDKKAAQAPL